MIEACPNTKCSRLESPILYFTGGQIVRDLDWCVFCPACGTVGPGDADSSLAIDHWNDLPRDVKGATS